ncbi:MAG: CopG family transcriptional regulator [Thermomicrobiales bacterium]
MKKTTVYFSEETGIALKELGRRTGRRQADLIRDAVGEYLARQDRPLPRTMGIYASGEVTSNDVEDWLVENWKPDW